MISHVGRYRAASSEQCLANAAVIEKLPAAITPRPHANACCSMSRKSSAANPEVPMTILIPAWSASNVRLFTDAGSV